MISYSPRSAKAIGFLKRYYNDIEIFVEDTTNRNMWMRVLSNILPRDTRLSSVNSLGGRDGVMQACKLDQRPDGRKRLYIVDGDFDFLKGTPKPRLKHLYRLQAYCLENLLLRDESLTEVGYSNCTESTRQTVASTVAWQRAIVPHERLLRALYVLYGCAEKLRLGIQTVGYNVHRLMSRVNGSYVLDPIKVRTRIRSFLKEAVARAGREVFTATRKEVLQRAGRLGSGKFVSGKDCLLPVLWQRLRSLSDCSIELEQFKVQLAKEFRAEHEPLLARRIAMAVRT